MNRTGRICDAKLNNACIGLINDTFYRCDTCSFGYVCCMECYKEEMTRNKRKRVVKRKQYES